MNTINIEEFQKVEIRVGTVLSAEKAEGADKLLKLIFDFGPKTNVILSENEGSQSINKEEASTEKDSSPLVQNDNKKIATSAEGEARKDEERDTRQIMSAIAELFPDPSVLVGKQICVCTNLEPRVFRGHESQGMLLAVDNPDGGITFVGPEEKVPAGTRIH